MACSSKEAAKATRERRQTPDRSAFKPKLILAIYSHHLQFGLQEPEKAGHFFFYFFSALIKEKKNPEHVLLESGDSAHF